MNYLSEFEKQKAKRNELIKNSQQIYYLQTKKEKIMFIINTLWKM